MDLQKRVNNVSRPDSEPLSTLSLNYLLQKLFVRNLLMIAFNKHDWSWFMVPGLNQLDQTYELDVLGFSNARRGWCGSYGRSVLVSQISVSNMTQRLQGRFIFQLSAVENLETVEAAIAQHIRTIQTEPVTEVELARIRTQVANRFFWQ